MAELQSEQAQAASEMITNIVDNIDSVIQGKHDVVELVVCALIARGHVLLEDLPGTGKTTLVSTLARSIDVDFKRIQFTPDVMPSDVSGFSIFNQRTQDFEFRPGGVMSNLVLADEINRASAKTQSALLEAMEERQVTVDGVTRKLNEPFMVLATQNPIEQFGTYPLPEAQLDRFLVKLSLGYPDFNQEMRVLDIDDDVKAAVRPVATGPDIEDLRATSKKVYASTAVKRYIIEIITSTRNNPEIQIGSSPRGGIALLALSRAYALTRGRTYITPDDAKVLAAHVLRHRLTLSHEAKVADRTPDEVIAAILSSIAVPFCDEDEMSGLKMPDEGLYDPSIDEVLGEAEQAGEAEAEEDALIAEEIAESAAERGDVLFASESGDIASAPERGDAASAPDAVDVVVIEDNDGVVSVPVEEVVEGADVPVEEAVDEAAAVKEATEEAVSAVEEVAEGMSSFEADKDVL